MFWHQLGCSGVNAFTFTHPKKLRKVKIKVNQEREKKGLPNPVGMPFSKTPQEENSAIEETNCKKDKF